MQFNDSVVYVRDGKSLPAIVLKSQQSPDGELLALLYADPVAGPRLVLDGTFRGVAQVASAVPPLKDGAKFGWEDVEAADLRAWKAKPKPTIEELEAILNSEGEFPIKINPDGSISADLKPTAPEQLDEAQGPVTPGDPESPHAIPGGVESHAPAHEIKTYSDGTVVSGPGPMPELSPAQQDAAELVRIKAAQNQPDA
jgi:hypothetical protein